MKRSYTLYILVLLLLISFSIPITSAQQRSIVSRWASTPPKIDAIISSEEWGRADSITLSAGKDPAFDAQIWFLNDGVNLYIAMKFRHKPGKGSEYQFLYLYIDVGNDHVIKRGLDLLFYVCIEDYQKLHTVYIYDYIKGIHLKKKEVAPGEWIDEYGNRYAVAMVGEGLNLEMAVKLKMLNISAGQSVGLLVYLKAGYYYYEYSKAVWPSDGVEDNPETYGDILLSFEAVKQAKPVISSLAAYPKVVVVGGTTRVVAVIKNVGSVAAIDVSAELKLGKGLRLAGGESAKRTISRLEPGESRVLTWVVEALKEGDRKVEVSVSAFNSIHSSTASIVITVYKLKPVTVTTSFTKFVTKTKSVTKTVVSTATKLKTLTKLSTVFRTLTKAIEKTLTVIKSFTKTLKTTVSKTLTKPTTLTSIKTVTISLPSRARARMLVPVQAKYPIALLRGDRVALAVIRQDGPILANPVSRWTNVTPVTCFESYIDGWHVVTLSYETVPKAVPTGIYKLEERLTVAVREGEGIAIARVVYTNVGSRSFGLWRPYSDIHQGTGVIRFAIVPLNFPEDKDVKSVAMRTKLIVGKKSYGVLARRPLWGVHPVASVELRYVSPDGEIESFFIDYLEYSIKPIQIISSPWYGAISKLDYQHGPTRKLDPGAAVEFTYIVSHNRGIDAKMKEEAKKILDKLRAFERGAIPGSVCGIVRPLPTSVVPMTKTVTSVYTKTSTIVSPTTKLVTLTSIIEKGVGFEFLPLLLFIGLIAGVLLGRKLGR